MGTSNVNFQSYKAKWVYDQNQLTIIFEQWYNFMIIIEETRIGNGKAELWN